VSGRSTLLGRPPLTQLGVLPDEHADLIDVEPSRAGSATTPDLTKWPRRCRPGRQQVSPVLVDHHTVGR